MLSKWGVTALGVAAFISLVSAAGCEGPTGPSPAEVEAKKQAAEAERRANEERLLREQEAERRSKSEEAAQHYGTMSFVGWSIVVFIAGLIIGISLGLKTRHEYATQGRTTDRANPRDEADPTGDGNHG
jgi:hypothetical protein